MVIPGLVIVKAMSSGTFYWYEREDSSLITTAVRAVYILRPFIVSVPSVMLSARSLELVLRGKL